MSLWTCIQCGCRAIAHDLGFCPKCFEPKGEDVPKVTKGGATNAYEQESAVAPEAPQTAPEAPQEPAGPQDTPVDPGTPAPDALSELEAAAASLKRPAKPAQQES